MITRFIGNVRQRYATPSCMGKLMTMRKNSFVTIALGTGVLCVFLLIYKQTWLTGLSYQQQDLEKKVAHLTGERNNLQQQLSQLQNPDRVHTLATTQLGMTKLSLSSTKTIQLAHDCRQ